MKILYILPEYLPHSGGGISTYYIQHIKKIALFCEQIKVIIGSGYSQGASIFETENIKTEELDLNLFVKYLRQFEHLKLSLAFQRNIAAAWAMWDQAGKGEGYDIIECTDFGLGYIPWLVNHNTPVITRLHGSYGQIELNEPELNDKFNGDLNRQTELLMLNLCDELITHSEQNLKFWKKLLPSKKINYILPIYDEEPLKTVPKDQFGIVCGRIQQWKGPENLCKAIRFIPESDILIKWFGRDTHYSVNSSKSAYLKNTYPTIWGKKIVPQNELAHKEIKIKQSTAKFAVIPSTWDMFNFTLLEYLNAGTPVICSDGAGSSSLINHGINGLKYSRDNPTELSKCLEKVLSLTDDEYESIVQEGYKTMNTIFNSNIIVTKNVDLYSSILLSFQPKSSNIYVDEIYKPGEYKNSLAKVLDGISIKYLLRYMGNRLRRKIRL